MRNLWMMSAAVALAVSGGAAFGQEAQNAEPQGQGQAQPTAQEQFETLTEPMGELSAQDVAFVQMGILSNLAEITTAQLAVERAGNEQVRAFAQQMLQDHPPVHDQLVALATANGVPVPTQPDPVHQEMAQQLSTLSGADFDRLYMGGQVTDHQLGVDLFSREAAEGEHEAAVALATQTLPAMQMHLEMAQTLAAQVGAVTLNAPAAGQGQATTNQ